MLLPDLLDGGDSKGCHLFFLLVGQIGHTVQNVQTRVHLIDKLQHLFCQPAVAGESQVYQRVVE